MKITNVYRSMDTVEMIYWILSLIRNNGNDPSMVTCLYSLLRNKSTIDPNLALASGKNMCSM